MSIRNCIKGPLNKGEDKLTGKTIHNQGSWNLNCVSFILPHDFQYIITNIYLPPLRNKEDKLIWDDTPDGKFTLNGAYTILENNTTPFNLTLLIISEFGNLGHPVRLKYFCASFSTTGFQMEAISTISGLMSLPCVRIVKTSRKTPLISFFNALSLSVSGIVLHIAVLWLFHSLLL